MALDFKKTTDELFAPLSHGHLAQALGVSVALIRQARLSPEAHAYRAPPPGWERAVMALARRRARYYQKLAERLKNALAGAG